MTDRNILEHNFVKYAPDISEICCNLFKQSPINFFEPLKIYKDNSYSGFMSNGRWAEHFLRQDYQNIGIHEYQQEFGNDLILWKSSGLFNINEKTNLLYQDCIDFNFKNGLSIIENHENYVQFYYFATDSGTDEINPFFFENIQSLYNFIFYFNEIVSNNKKLQIAYNKKTSQKKIDKPSIDNKTQPSKFEVKNFHFTEQYIFTKRETQCLILTAFGYSSKMAGVRLKISSRTIETHLENAKIKSNEKTLSKLIERLKKISSFRFLIFEMTKNQTIQEI